MGMTIAEKIIAAAAGVDSVKPGDIHTVKLDRLMSNDGTTHLTEKTSTTRKSQNLRLSAARTTQREFSFAKTHPIQNARTL